MRVLLMTFSCSLACAMVGLDNLYIASGGSNPVISSLAVGSTGVVTSAPSVYAANPAFNAIPIDTISLDFACGAAASYIVFTQASNERTRNSAWSRSLCIDARARVLLPWRTDARATRWCPVFVSVCAGHLREYGDVRLEGWSPRHCNVSCHLR
jgi:hypothetical protein